MEREVMAGIGREEGGVRYESPGVQQQAHSADKSDASDFKLEGVDERQ